MNNEMQMGDPASLYHRICQTASDRPQETAVTELDTKGRATALTWDELRRATDSMACLLKEKGVQEGSRVVVALPNSLTCIVAPLSIWHLGGCVFFLSSQLTYSEKKILLDEIRPDLILSNWQDTSGYPSMSVSAHMVQTLPTADKLLPDISASPSKAITTGGSTGIPKIIVEESTMNYREEDFRQWKRVTGQAKGQKLLICGSLYHTLFNNSLYIALAMGNPVVLLTKFSETLALSAIETYRINSLVLVPTMMSRIAKSPRLKPDSLKSIQCMHHAGASCPVWLKKRWIELLGASRVYEFYSMSEKVGLTCIRGDEWLAHEGSVGRPIEGHILILDDEQRPVGTGTVGNVYFSSSAPRITHYLNPGQTFQCAGDDSHIVSMGDLGRLDEDGFLYLLDRRSDIIISGGKNISAAEVENTLREYSLVDDIVVIGLPDPLWGRRVHALIKPSCPPEEFDLYPFTSFGFRKICNTKLPKTIELVSELPRDEAGKIRRRLLVEEREKTANAADVFHYQSLPNGHQLLAWKKSRRKKR